MAVYQRGKIWWIDYYYRGRRIRESVSESKQEATRALQARMGDIVRGEFRIKGRDRESFFQEFALEYAKHLKLTRRGWKKELSRLKMLVRHFGKKLLSAVTPYDVERFKTSRRVKVAGSSVNRELALLKTMYSKARQWGFSGAENPVKGVRYYSERQRERILGDEDSRRLVAACGESVRPVVVVALNTGMRLSEILDLRWEDVDLDRRYLRVERSKNNRSRKIPMSSLVREVLLELRGRGGSYVFTKAGSAERLRSVRTAFMTACRRAALEGLRFHDLRHTFATNLVMNGVDLVTVKEILGHSDIAMTVRYSHPSDARKMEAVERLAGRKEADLDSALSGDDSHNLVTVAASASKGPCLTH
jgi:integrase